MLGDRLTARFGGAWQVRALGASAWCDTWRADGPAGTLFVKSTPGSRAAVLEAEADGLRALAVPGGPQVPAVAGCWVDGNDALLALAWLDFARPVRADFGPRFGCALATLHRSTAPGGGRFGWHRDNWLGGTPQRNRWSAQGGRAGWLAFVAEARLCAFADGLPAPLPALARRVADALPGRFDDGHVPRPVLIHGDLWSGNWGALGDGTPVVFDPAVSVSDPKAELAMMELFGAPPPGFWPAYDEVLPLAPGYARRRPVYQLVHLLNHARLFGGGYRRQAQALAESVLQGR